MSNFKVFGCDTDSIIFCKPDGAEISEDEQKLILARVNALYPSQIRWEDDGYYKTSIVFKAKNYVLHDPTAEKEKDKLKTKGSALKDSKKEKALKEFQSAIINSILEDRNDFRDIYHQYVREILAVKDMSRWSSKKSITEKVLTGTGTTQVKIRTAIEGTDYRAGDKVFVYFKMDESYGLLDTFDGEYNWVKLLGKLHKSTELFEKILPVKDLFIKYHNKRKQVLLEAFKEQTETTKIEGSEENEQLSFLSGW